MRRCDLLCEVCLDLFVCFCYFLWYRFHFVVVVVVVVFFVASGGIV